MEVLRRFTERRIFIVEMFAPNCAAGSNTAPHRRCEDRRPARQCSGILFDTDKKSPLANGISDHFQASQPCPQHQSLCVFEPVTPYGKKFTTKKIFCFLQLNIITISNMTLFE